MPNSPISSSVAYATGRHEDPKSLYPSGIVDERGMNYHKTGLLAGEERWIIGDLEEEAKKGKRGKTS